MRTLKYRLVASTWIGIFAVLGPIRAQENLLRNPEFAGDAGAVVGDMTLDTPVPDSWRAFAVGGSIGSFRVVPVGAGELFPGSPAANGACLTISVFAGDRGFDHDFGGNRVPLIGGTDYVAEFWVKSGNADGTDQAYEMIFPIFGSDGALLGSPGGVTGVATAEWTRVIAPAFSDAAVVDGFVRWRPTDDGGENTICVALPTVRLAPPDDNLVINPEFAGEGGPTVGVVTLLTPVPDNWRAFGVQGGEVEFETMELDEGDVFPQSPAVRSACLNVTTFGNHGFDHDFANAHFPLIPNVEYHAEFWVKTYNSDDSDQAFNFTLYVFGGAGGPRAHSSIAGVATDDWEKFVGPTFSDPAAMDAFVRWTVSDDGGPNGICIALPGVFQDSVGALPPSGLFCRRVLSSVELSWENNGAYDSILILRDGVDIVELAPDATSYVDTEASPDIHSYQVVAIADGLEDGPSCDVNLVEVPAGTTVSVDFGDPDEVTGLENTQTGPNTDGENEFTICGPEDDLREARSNLADQGPNANTDNYLYLNVTDPDMKAQQAFLLTATVYDDPGLAGVGLVPQYTNNKATGPSDIANAFFPLGGGPVQFLGGTDQWIELSWQIPDAGFRSFQQGTSDLRIHITDTVSRVCFDRVDLTFLPFPGEFSCERSATGVDLTWSSPIEYDEVFLLRDGDEIAALEGDATSYSDSEVDDGDHVYDLLVSVGEFETSVSCSISVFVVPPGTSVLVDLGFEDVEDGLINSQRGENTDGENEEADCGPGDDLREARSNKSASDDDFADNYYYFNVIDEAMKSQAELTIRVTVFDDPQFAPLGLILQYTNRASTGSADIPNTFYPLDGSNLQALQGTGEWVTLEWDLPDPGFRSFQQGTSDFRIGVTQPVSICVDAVEVVFQPGPEGPADPVFHRGDVNGDGLINISDGVNKLEFLFGGGSDPRCPDAADADDDGALTISGAVYIFNWLFASGAEPPAPGPTTSECGPDPTEDALVNADCVYEGC